MAKTTKKPMNRSEFTARVAKEHNCTKVEAERIINIFISSITSALAAGYDIQLIGFGKFYTSKVPAKAGRNPQTGKPMTIAARTQVRFSVGEKLKSACNSEE